MGIVKQLKDALNRRCVKRLTQTYLTLSLEDIASKTGVASAAAAEQTLLEMVCGAKRALECCQSDASG